MDRRQLITRSGAAFAALGSGMAFGSLRALAEDMVTLPFANGERPLVKYPQKRPMIGLTSRPPQLETPFSVFDESAITPNDAFFVRYHLAGVPYDIDPDIFSVEIKGDQTIACRHQEDGRGRTGGGQSMLRQQPRLLRAARRGRSARQWRDGQRAMEGRPAQSGA